MGIIRDILDLKDDLKDTEQITGTMKNRIFKSGKKYSSISRRASEGICYVPVLVSDTSDIETTQMVCKALERNYADFLMTCISMNSTMDLRKTENISDFIKNFHQNADTRTSMNDVIHMASELTESYNVVTDEELGRIYCSRVYEGIETVSEAMRMDLFFNNNGGYMAGLNESVVNDFVLPTENMAGRIVLEAKHGKKPTSKGGEGRGNSKSFDELLKDIEVPSDNNDTGNGNTKGKQQHAQKSTPNKNNGMPAMVKPKNNQNAHAKSVQKPDNHRATAPTTKLEIKHQEKFNVTDYDRKDFNKAMLMDNDVKKANELVPTMLHVNINFFDGERITGSTDAIIGVKCNMHLIKSEEMMTNLVFAIQNKGKLFRFVKWTTGEIDFFKDLVFNVSSIRRDVVNRSEGASSWWTALKRRKALQKVSVATFSGNTIMPNSSIVISMDEVDYIKTNYGFDFMNPDVAKKLMDEFFLLGFVVVDHSTQVVHIMYDGKQNFDSVTFSGLERENSSDAKKFKDLLKSINRN